MASFRKRGDYQWQVRVSKKGYPPQTKTFETKADAEQWARDTESEMVKGHFISRAEADSTTLSDALDRYLREITPLKKGWQSETNRIKTWKKHKLAARFLGSLKGSDFAQYRDECRTAGLAENSIRLSLAIISHLFNIASKEWGIQGLTNPTQTIRMPRGSKPRDRRIEAAGVPDIKTGQVKQKSEIDLIIDASESSELSAIILLAIETAMRRSEIAKLEWDHINLKHRTAHLPDTKPGDSRDVPLSSRAVAILKTLPKRIIKDEATGKSHSDPKVFSMRPDSMTRAFARARDRARKKYLLACELHNTEANPRFLVDIRLHDQRHEGTSRLFETGRFDTMEVAAVTGHKTLQMLKRYTHLKAADLAKKLD